MADKKTSELDPVSLPLDGTEIFPIVQGGETKRIPSTEVKDYSADHYKGFYNILTNSPAISDATGVFGEFFRMSHAGTRDFGSGPITVGVDDILAFDGASWYKHVDNNQTSGDDFLYINAFKNLYNY